MLISLKGPLLALGMLTASIVPTHAESPNYTPKDLTESQITRFLNSYTAVHSMMKKYWGKRRYTPPRKMLAPKGTIKRAITEMDAAGVLPDFIILLESFGFENHEVWLQLGERISYSYVHIRMQTLHPGHTARRKGAFEEQLKMLETHYADAHLLPERQRKAAESQLASVRENVERERYAEHDAELIGRLMSDVEKYDQYFYQVGK